MKLKAVDKIENGINIGQVYRISIITNYGGDIDVYDGSEVDWRELVDGATIDVHEYEVPVKK